MKTIASCVALLVVGLLGGIGFAGRSDRNSAANVTSLGPTVGQLQKLSKLVTLNVPVADVLIGEDAGNKYRGAWLLKGDALISVDISLADFGSVDTQAKTATVTLPKPSVLQARVDHERTKTWSVEKQTWVPFVSEPRNLRDDSMRVGQLLVEKTASSPENITKAKEQADLVIGRFYEALGWKVSVKWRE